MAACDICNDGVFVLRARHGQPRKEIPCPYCVGVGVSDRKEDARQGDLDTHPNYPLVVVEWEDASNVATWDDIESAQAFDSYGFDYHCTNVGYLIRDDDECVVVAARASGNFKAVGLFERIPRRMVLNVRKVG